MMFLFVAALGTAGAEIPPAHAGVGRPNFIFIMADDMG